MQDLSFKTHLNIWRLISTQSHNCTKVTSCREMHLLTLSNMKGYVISNHWLNGFYWCAILIAHQIVMAKHEGSCVHFSGISTCGRTSPKTVSHPQRQLLPTAYKISLPVHVIVTNKRLQLLATTLYNSLVLSFSLLKSSRRLIRHRAFCATCVVGALSALQMGGLQQSVPRP